MKNIFVGVAIVALAAAGCNSKSSNSNSISTSTTTLTQYTMSDIQAANNKVKCWTVINGNVYDLTKWISQHPGGQQAILSICGKDGSQVFSQQHGGQARPEQELASFQIGTLKQ